MILATHADQALQILGDQATDDEKRILGGFHFSKNRAVLHADLSVRLRELSKFLELTVN